MIRRSWLAAVVLAGIVAGCQNPPPNAYVGGTKKTAAAAVPVGKNIAGEACRYQLVAGGIAGGREADLYCGNWDLPSGHIVELPGPADSARLASAAQAGPWRAYIDRHFRCGPPAATQLFSGAPARLMQCTRRVGGWPQLALTAIVGGRVFAADAVQPALPAVESAIASLSGQSVPAAAAGRSPAERLIAQRGGGAVFGSGDEGRFFQELHLGDAYNNIDEPVQAERHYRDALAIQERVLGPNDPGLALTMMKLAAQVAHQGDAPEAARLLARAAQLVAAHPDPLSSAELDFYRATTAAYENKIPAALALVQRAEAAFLALAPEARTEMAVGAPAAGENRGLLRGGGLATLVSDETPGAAAQDTAISGLAEAMRLHATLLQLRGQYAAAGEMARRAERLLAASGLSISSTGARSLRLIASNQAVAGEYPAAAGTSAAAGNVFARVAPSQCPQASNLLSEGYYLFRSQHLAGALDRFRKAGAILRDPNVVGCAVLPYRIHPWLDALATAPGNRAELDAEMFEAAQYARSGATAQDIARATAALIAGNPKAAATIRAIQERSKKLDSLEAERVAAAQGKASAAQLADLDKRIAAAKKAKDEAEAAIQATAPRYSQAAEKPVDLAQVQKVLGGDEALAFFFVSDAGSYGFFVRPHGIVAYKVPLNRAQIRHLIDRLRDTTVAKPGGLPTPDFAASYRLYSALFGPVEQRLAGVRLLTVAAGGDLLRYPLEALVTRPGVSVSNGDYRQVPFLVRRVALSYVPAPRILVNIRSARAINMGLRPFIGFGDFRPASPAQLAASFPPQRCGDDARLLAGLQRLPDTGAQVATIARQLGASAGDIVLGDAFTKRRLAQPDLARYRIVLLATHGFFPAGRLHCMSEPAITVSAPPRAADAAGEFETPSDIAQLKLNADLVALSACDTSGASAGESLGGLARAFFLAGARGLLVTHWSIVTPASVPLMEGTFAARGQDSAQALRAAQLHMIDSAGSGPMAPIEISHPNYWAAFVLIGDGVRAGPGV